MSAPDRRGRLDRDHSDLSVRRQCVLLGVARSSVYRPPRPANDNDLMLMRRIDELFKAWPFLGSRRLTVLLRAEGYSINRKRVRRLMRRMGISALAPKPKTTKPAFAEGDNADQDITLERAPDCACRKDTLPVC
jgi:putative transposase